MIELNAQLYHLCIRYNPLVKEGVLDLSGEHALVEGTCQLRLREVLKLLVDQEFDQVVRVFKNTSKDLAVEFMLREIWRLPRVERLLIVVIRQLVDEALVVLSGMVVPALHTLRTLALLALVYLVVEGVVDLLLPAMAPGAVGLQRTTFMILTDEGACLPVLAELSGVVIEQVGLAAEVMPVVGIDALSLVVGLDEWTPLGLEVVHEETGVACHLMDQPSLDVVVGVRE